MQIDATEIAAFAKYLNLILLPISIWIIRLEHRLTRIETILELKQRKKENT